MIAIHPRILLGVAVLLLLVGWVLPVLMVLKILESTLFLNFFSYIASVLGLFLGIISLVNMVTRYRKK
ncbi:MAG TPA: hypothetical protein VMT46_14140 [Anaerolineaceae bacterium]|nr:hypothetical protein [Anaerolineaceae bacterium]